MLAQWERPNGMAISKVSVPFGVIGIIYEARPNVTFDVFSLCFKAGSACVLKGGSDAHYSNTAIVDVINSVLIKHGIDTDTVVLLPNDREVINELLTASGYVDLIIPRGSKGLIDFVRQNAKVPVIETGAGVCHTYFDRAGDLEKGRDIVFNAKTRRVSVCNALDCLIVHRERLADLPALCAPLAGKDVVIYADGPALAALQGAYPEALLRPADDHSFGTEFLDYKMALKTVDSLDGALQHIARYSSQHSECIVSEDAGACARFTREVDAACVYTNVSTAFTDGGQFGFRCPDRHQHPEAPRPRAHGSARAYQLQIYCYRKRTSAKITKKHSDMRHFTSVKDLGDLNAALQEAFAVKADRFAYQHLGKNKTLIMIFFSSSLRTRLSTQKAAMNLGMNVIVLDINQGAWKLETERGVIMDGDKTEHLLEAIPVIGCYCDVIGVRSFARFENKADDYEEKIISQFIQYSGRPVFSMEAATRHPLQSFADLITIEEYKKTPRPKVVLTWAPHPKALPQAVANSFAEWMNETDYDFVITHPEGYELDPRFVGKARVEYDQRKAFEGADFIYAKNWSAYTDPNYGKVINTDRSWTVDAEKMALTNNAYFMHCLPVRRNMIVTDEVIESPQSIVIPEAANREISAQVVLKKILESL